MACYSCGDMFCKERFCSFCDKLYFKEERLRERETKKEEPPKKIVKKIVEKDCVSCKKTYMPVAIAQKYCYADCRPKELTEAEKWINKKPRVQKYDSNQVAYGFFRKKYGVLNRFKSCRG